MIKSITSTWFECIVAYDKVQDNGTTKKVTEQYVVDALTFTEAESVIIEKMKAYISGEFSVKNINPAPYKEIFFSEKENEGCWFRVKVAFIQIDAMTQQEKRTNLCYLVQADTAETASKNANEVLANGMLDYRLTANVETKILDVFRHE